MDKMGNGQVVSRKKSTFANVIKMWSFFFVLKVFIRNDNTVF